MKKTTAAPAKKPVAKGTAAKAPAKAAPAKAGAKAPAKTVAKKAAPEKKKEEEKVVEEEEKVEEKIAPVEQMKAYQIQGESVIKFNHYKQSFKHVDGRISWDAIDEEYCFSDVYEDGYELKMIIETDEKEQQFKDDNYLVCQDTVFQGLENQYVYVIECKEGWYKPTVKNSDDEKEEEEKQEEPDDKDYEDESEVSMAESEDMYHPKNRVAFHELVIDKELEQTKDFTGLDMPGHIGNVLNKRMKCIQNFQKPDVDQSKKLEDQERVYYNTFRNGFVSAFAMSYNFHLPLILSPGDIWLVVLQGFKTHMSLNKDKEFITFSFADLDKLTKTVKSKLILTDETIGIGKNSEKYTFDSYLTDKILNSRAKVWDEKHMHKAFAPLEAGGKLPNIQKISEVFDYSWSTEFDIKMQNLKLQKKEHADACKEAKAKGKKEPEKPFKEDSADSIKKQESQNKMYKDFHQAQFTLASYDAATEMSIEYRQKQNCGIPKVKFLGTLADWKNLKKKITYLDRFGMHKWLDVLLPIINKFIEAIQKGVVDEVFWSKAYTVLPTSSANSGNKVNGWICNFFPYIGEDLREQFKHMGNVKRLFRERGNNYVTFMMNDDDFTRGFQFSNIEICKKEYLLLSGLIGVEFETQVPDPAHPDEILQSVRPGVGWFLYDEDSTKKDTASRVFISAETSGSLF